MEYRKPLRALQEKKKQEYKVDLVFSLFCVFLFDDIKKYIAVHEPSENNFNSDEWLPALGQMVAEIFYYVYINAVNNSCSQAITTKDLGIFNTVQETNGKTIYTR